MTDAKAPAPWDEEITQPIGTPAPVDMPWTVAARSKLGEHERTGDADNPFIVECLREVGLPGQHDETAWCSAFANWCVRQAGMQGSGSAAARSWLKWGQPIAGPVLGCIVVLWRESPDSAHGHVAFWMGTDQSGQKLYLLGGNQGNAVSVVTYPRARLLGYRWPLGVALP